MNSNRRIERVRMREPRHYRLYLSGFASILALSAAGAVSAQDAKGTQLQEVVVTAEKRTENLQTTAIAATVLDTSALNQKGVSNISDLKNATPSLSITNTGVVAFINLRGIGLDSNSPLVVPGVASYREGLWQPPVATGNTFYDIASVEVLRGPQGTFVGSNSTGGAIFINSKSPDFDGVHGNVEVKGGNYADLGATGAVNLPIDDKWAARVAFNVERRGSFFKNLGSIPTPSGAQFNTPGKLDEKDMRVGLLWKPNDTLQILFKSDFTDISTDGLPMKPIPGTASAPFAPVAPWTINFDQTTRSDIYASRNSLEIKWQPSPDGITFRSLTGYQYLNLNEIYDLDASRSPAGSAQFGAIIERPMTEEINIISPDTGRLSWVVGGYLFHDTRQVGIDQTNMVGPPHILIHFFTVLQTQDVFAQLTYKLLPSIELQVGGRYTHDSLDAPNVNNNYINVGPGFAFVDATGHHSDNGWTGKVALNWTPNDDNFLYAFAAKGLKAGGFQFGSPPGQFQPEIVWDYELGWKSYFFDRHVSTQIGGFYNNYQNLQVGVLNTGSGASQLTNIGKSTIKGVEAQIEGRFGGLHVDASGAYVNSALGAISLVNARLLPNGGVTNLGPQCTGGAVPPACFDYGPYTVSVSGRANPYSPTWTYNVGVEYRFDLGNDASLTPRVNYSYVGSQWTTLYEAPATDFLPSFGLWNASLTYTKDDWSVQGYATNLANKFYVIGQFGSGENFGNPRQFGVRISRAF